MTRNTPTCWDGVGPNHRIRLAEPDRSGRMIVVDDVRLGTLAAAAIRRIGRVETRRRGGVLEAAGRTNFDVDDARLIADAALAALETVTAAFESYLQNKIDYDAAVMALLDAASFARKARR